MIITQHKNEFLISFPFNPVVLAEVKAITGRWYEGRTKLWHVPVVEADAVNRLKAKYTIADKYTAKEEFAAIPDLPELSLDIPLKRELFAYQRKGVAYSLDKKRLIMGDQPGLGKSGQAIATIHGAALHGQQSFPCLIICPSSLKENWRREWNIWTNRKAVVMSDSIKNTWPQYLKTGLVEVFIINYESLKKYFVQEIKREMDPETNKYKPLTLKHIHFKETISLFKSVIIDECHRCKDSSTLQAKLVKGMTAKKEWVLGLTGTPVVNKPKDLIAQLAIVQRLADIGGYQYFIKRYCGGDGKGASNLKELHYKLSTTCFYQRQKKDVLLDLPDKMRNIILCDISTRKEYKEAEDNLKEYLLKWKNKTDAEVEKSLRGEIMVLMGIQKNISARGKMNEVIEYVDEVVESGEKVVVFVHQKEIALALLHHYPKAVSIRGDDSMDARQRSVDGFQRDPNIQVIICSIKAAGVGITLTASSRVAFVELPWHGADCDQCEDRTHRIGQKNAVQVSYFLGKDTIDEYIYELIESKRGVANDITGTVDNIQREIIDRLADSLFNTKKVEEVI